MYAENHPSIQFPWKRIVYEREGEDEGEDDDEAILSWMKTVDEFTWKIRRI